MDLKLKPEEMLWWREMKFGMFIHWGLYALHGRGEWAMFNERIDIDEYAKLADQFKPHAFDAEAWAQAAKNAGMKYMVLTTRHHDGFCLFDSKVSDFTSTKTAAGRDFVAEYVAACRKAGLRVGLYYSPLDWRFPGFFFPNMYRASAEAMKRQTYEQIREILTQYGQIDILWYDGGENNWLGHGGLEFGNGGWHSRARDKPYTGAFDWEAEKLNAMVRELQPGIVINPRSGWEGDFDTPECKIGSYNTERPWETCDCLAGGWGWSPKSSPRSLRECIQLLVKVAVGDGNLLLNVGPRPDGAMEPEQVRRLAEVGDWLSRYGESLYGTRGGPIPPHQHWGGTTHKSDRVYVHILDWRHDTLVLPRLDRRVVASSSLTASSVTVTESDAGIAITVPPADRQAPDTIVALDLE